MTSRAISHRKARFSESDTRNKDMHKFGLMSAGMIAIFLACPTLAPAQTQSFSSDQRSEIERIVKEYLLAHPELLQDVMNELEKHQAVADAEKHRTAISQYSETIFTSAHQVNLG